MKAQIDDVIEVFWNDKWIQGTVKSVRNGVLTIVLKRRRSPITQRKQSDEGVTWRPL